MNEICQQMIKLLSILFRGVKREGTACSFSAMFVAILLQNEASKQFHFSVQISILIDNDYCILTKPSVLVKYVSSCFGYFIYN